MLAASRGEMPKNCGVEAVDVVEEAAHRVAIFPGASRVRVVERVDVPAVGRHLA